MRKIVASYQHYIVSWHVQYGIIDLIKLDLQCINSDKKKCIKYSFILHTPIYGSISSQNVTRLRHFNETGNHVFLSKIIWITWIFKIIILVKSSILISQTHAFRNSDLVKVLIIFFLCEGKYWLADGEVLLNFPLLLFLDREH